LTYAQAVTPTAKIANLLTVVLPSLTILACIVVKGAFRGLQHAHVGWLLRAPALRDRGQVDQRVVAGHTEHGRGVAHNHHAFPRSATHGLRPLELDLSGAVIWSMEELGLVWDVVRITPERQTQRRAPAAGAAPRGR
jgi:hypothetical protein